MKKLVQLRTKVYAARHKALVRGFSGLAPYYIVNEFPKSGGTWLSLMLADAMNLPFRRNQPIRIEKAVTHGHFLDPRGLRNTIVLWRDPRDLLVSFYFHCYFRNEHQNSNLVDLMKVSLPFDDYRDVGRNLPIFIEHISKSPVSPNFSWPQFADIWANRAGTVQSSYEELRKDTPHELSRVFNALTGKTLDDSQAKEVADRHCFAKAKQGAMQANNASTEMSFIREGSIGGWRRHFSDEALGILEDCGYAAPMKQLGYDFQLHNAGDTSFSVSLESNP